MDSKLKCVFLMTVLVFSITSIAQERTYKAIPGPVDIHEDCIDFIDPTSTDIALVPYNIWAMYSCKYVTLSCSQGLGALWPRDDFGIQVAGHTSENSDPDIIYTIIITEEEFLSIADPSAKQIDILSIHD